MTTNPTPTTALFSYLALDPRKGPEQIPSPATTMGIEVTSRALADACGLGSVDEQHGFHRAPAGATWPAPKGRAAVMTAWEPAFPLPPAGSTLAFLKPDVDSIGAAAVLVLRALGYPMPARPPACEDALRAGHDDPHSVAATDCDCAGQGQCRSPIYWCIERIATADAFSPGAEWTPRPLPTVEAPWPTGAAPVEETRDLAALGVICSPTREQAQHPLALRVAVVAAWMAHEYDLRHADRYAPPHVVSSIASIAAACGVDADAIQGLLAELNRAEAYSGTPETDRWGGNLTSGIIGSPQGHGSRLEPETILGMLVTKHLRG